METTDCTMTINTMELTPAQVVSLMQQTAHPFGPGTACPMEGGPDTAGAGIVDAARAVAAAVGGVTPKKG